MLIRHKFAHRQRRKPPPPQIDVGGGAVAQSLHRAHNYRVNVGLTSVNHTTMQLYTYAYTDSFAGGAILPGRGRSVYLRGIIPCSTS